MGATHDDRHSAVDFPGRGRPLTRRGLGAWVGLAGALTGCSQPEAAAPQPIAKGPVTLVVNHTAGRQEGPTYEEIYHAAEARLPGLKTEQVVGGPEKVLAIATAGTPLDVVRVSGGSVFTSFACQGIVQPVDEYLKRGEYPAKDAMPIAMEGAQWRGRQYGITFHLGGNVVYFNQTLFEKQAAKLPTAYAGERRWTWETFQEAARAVSGGTESERTWTW
ncbi:MAG: ABC transporter substrate-binding protein [Chloroflexota bacterium]